MVVYVKGRPLVLREDERPFKNMQVGSLSLCKGILTDTSFCDMSGLSISAICLISVY